MDDDALEVIWRPWTQTPPTFAEGDAVLFAGARVHTGLSVAPTWFGVTSQATHAAAWRAEGHAWAADVPTDRSFAAGLLLPSAGDRRAGVAELARVVQAVRPGGDVIVAAPNKLGGARIGEELARFCGEVTVESKRHCRIHRAIRPEVLPAAVAEAADADAVRQVLDGSFLSRPGLFSWDEADPGSRLLVRHLPERISGVAVDVGAGWGWLARAVRDRGPAVLHLIEIDARALDLAVQNVPSTASTQVIAHHHDGTLGLPVRSADVIVTNPPFHRDGRVDPGLGLRLLQVSAEALAADGTLWAVANRHLPYEASLRLWFGSVVEVANQDGYKVLRCRAPTGRTSETPPEPNRPPPHVRKERRLNARRERR